FTTAITTLHNHAVTTYLEIGPDTTLTPHIHTTTPPNTLITPTLHRTKPENHTLTTAIATLHTHGTPINWTTYYENHHPTPPHELPTYPFQHQRYWLDAPARCPHTPPPGEADATMNEEAEATDEAPVPILPDTLSGASDEEWEAALLDVVRTHAAEVLGYASPKLIEPEDNFLEIGFSSFTALEVRNRLCEATGLELPPVLLFDHPTPRDLASHLATELAPGPRTNTA
ncbi:phosphopantetheine-binding protein, partial [Streptomyces sp. NPDC007983]|uniref:acyl carrier protein n=1 Tax=Streptomyces sp. NPDC007983 TaxID=3364800 RepID=UPI0036F02AFF